MDGERHSGHGGDSGESTILLIQEDTFSAHKTAEFGENERVILATSRKELLTGLRIMNTAEKSAAGMQIILCDARALPIKDASISTASVLYALERYPQDSIKSILREIRRTVQGRKKISIILRSPEAGSPAQETDQMLKNILMAANRIYGYDIMKLPEQLEKSGFEDITMEIINTDRELSSDVVDAHIVAVPLMIAEKRGGDEKLHRMLREYIGHIKEEKEEYGGAPLPGVRFKALNTRII